jgi:hypothetical protein
MSDEPERPDPEIPQDPGIPGSKEPDELPAEEDDGSAPGPLPSEPEVDDVPDSDMPDYDEEGHIAPSGKP